MYCDIEYFHLLLFCLWSTYEKILIARIRMHHIFGAVAKARGC
jgi:hypothetical protein